jgi:hypothetical protein
MFWPSHHSAMYMRAIVSMHRRRLIPTWKEYLIYPGVCYLLVCLTAEKIAV